MEIVVIGGIAAGMSTAAKAARMNPEAHVTVIEKENYISFGACGLPYYVGGQFADEAEMFARTPEQMAKTGIELLLEHEVTSVDFAAKKVHMSNLLTGADCEKTYDRLMIATGASPVRPPIPGIEAENVFTMTKVRDAKRLKIELEQANRIVLIGGGFIGVEMADQLVAQGKEVTLIEAAPAIMNGPFDSELSTKMQDALAETGVKVVVDTQVTALQTENNRVTCVQTSGADFPADAVLLAVGFKPNTQFLNQQLETLANGALKINAYGETSMPDVYSAGDCASVPHRLLGDVYLPLATYANKMGRIVGTNIALPKEAQQAYVGALGSSAIKVGEYEAASTGLTEKQAKAKGYQVKTTCIETNNHSNYYTVQEKITIKLVYDAETFVLYGAQLFGKNETVLRATGLTTAIHAGLTTKEIGFIDYAYAPPFASTWEAINVAANTAK